MTLHPQNSSFWYSNGVWHRTWLPISTFSPHFFCTFTFNRYFHEDFDKIAVYKKQYAWLLPSIASQPTPLLAVADILGGSRPFHYFFKEPRRWIASYMNWRIQLAIQLLPDEIVNLILRLHFRLQLVKNQSMVSCTLYSAALQSSPLVNVVIFSG